MGYEAGALTPKSPPTVVPGNGPVGVTVSPDLTIITAGPSGVTHDPTPTFGFTSFKPGATFQVSTPLSTKKKGAASLQFIWSGAATILDNLVFQ